MSVPELTQTTRTAHWGWDEHRYFGHRVFGELAGKASFTSLLALSIVGRPLPADCIAVLDDIAGVVTLADPRIWPLKLTRVLASYGSVIPAVAAGLLMEDGARIGPSTTVYAAQALRAFHSEIGDRADDVDLVQSVVNRYLETHPFVWGFGTPFRSRDERLVAFDECMRGRGRDTLPHFRTMHAVAQAVRAARRAEPNMGIGLAAVLLDMGLTPEQIGGLVTALMQHMFFGHAVEEAASPNGPLRELPPAYVAFAGREPRTSPRAAEARTVIAASARADDARIRTTV
jgi:hypothetical protein